MVGLVFGYGISWLLGRVRSNLISGSTHDMVIIFELIWLRHIHVVWWVTHEWHALAP